MRENLQVIPATSTARGLLGSAIARRDRAAEASARSSLAAANIAATVRREIAKGHPITRDHAAALAALLVEVAA